MQDCVLHAEGRSRFGVGWTAADAVSWSIGVTEYWNAGVLEFSYETSQCKKAERFQISGFRFQSGKCLVNDEFPIHKIDRIHSFPAKA